MELLQWMNRLDLKDSLFKLVDQHYFKYMLFVKLTSGSGLKPEDAEECECEFNTHTLTITLSFGKKVSVPKMSRLVEDNIDDLEYDIQTSRNTIIITIHSEEEEECSLASILNSDA